VTNDHQIRDSAARLLAGMGQVGSAMRAAGARAQTACNATERRFWQAVQAALREGSDTAPLRS
jgi:hypothetical protein